MRYKTWDNMLARFSGPYFAYGYSWYGPSRRRLDTDFAGMTGGSQAAQCQMTPLRGRPPYPLRGERDC